MNAPDLTLSTAAVKPPTDAPATSEASGPAPVRKRANTSGQLRRGTLVLLRWCAVVGQSLALLIVSQVLGFEFPLLPCLAMIGLSILVNVVVTASFELDRRVGDREAGLQLGFDLLQLAALLWLTGGMANPFALLFLAPVVTSATTLNKKVLLSLGLLATAFSFGLIYNSQPLPWSPPGSFELPVRFRLGVFSAIIIGSAFTSLYAWRATRESRTMANALAATEAVLAHEQKLSALGGMAAAAAHELGTPLATIQVIAKEMTRELDSKTHLGEDAALMLSQAQRCREILAQLSLRGDEGDVIHDILSIEDVLEEAAEPYITFEKDISLDVSGEGDPPVLKRQADRVIGFGFSGGLVPESAERDADSIIEIGVRADSLSVGVWEDNVLVPFTQYEFFRRWTFWCTRCDEIADQHQGNYQARGNILKTLSQHKYRLLELQNECTRENHINEKGHCQF